MSKSFALLLAYKRRCIKDKENKLKAAVYIRKKLLKIYYDLLKKMTNQSIRKSDNEVKANAF